MGDDSLCHHNTFLAGPNEPLSADEGFVPRVRPGNRHVNRWIAATNFPQPCQRGSGVGIPYFCSYVRQGGSTSSLALFPCLIRIPIPSPPPLRAGTKCRHSI